MSYKVVSWSPSESLNESDLDGTWQSSIPLASIRRLGGKKLSIECFVASPRRSSTKVSNVSLTNAMSSRRVDSSLRGRREQRLSNTG